MGCVRGDDASRDRRATRERVNDSTQSSPRVAFLIDSMGVGGSELAAARTARALGLGERLLVMHLQASGPLMERYREIDARMLHVPAFGIRDPRLLRTVWQLASELRRHRIDVLHTHDYYSNILGAVAVHLAPATRLIASRRWIHQYVRPIHARLDGWAQRSASLVLVNSEAVAEHCRRVVHVPKGKIRVLPNFVADDLFEPPQFVQSDVVVVGMVGRLAAVKNHRLAFEAFRDAHEHVPALRLAVCGEGELDAELRRDARELGIDSLVEFRGRVPEGPAVHRSFDIELLTSTSEGSPNAVLEGMVAGRPVVATSVGGVPELVEDGVNGILVASGDREGVAKALVRLAASPELRKTMGMAGFARASERHRQSVFTRTLESMYRRR